MRSAITRRTPITLISDVSAETSARDAARAGSSRSLRIMRPPGPDPATLDKSIPASRARRRLAGEVITRPVRAAAGGGVAVGALALGGTAAATGLLVAGAAAAAAAGAASPSTPVSNTISGEPTAILAPGTPLIDSTRPLTGAGTSTAALSVITSTMSWSSVTASPGLVCQATISASTVPSPRSGILHTYWFIPTP